VSSWTPRQTLGGDVQVPDRWVEVEAGGVLRRLEAGTDPLPSSLKTFYRDADNPPLAYWTMEHGPLSISALPELGEGRIIWTNARLDSADVAPWLETGVSIASGTTLSAEVVGMTAVPTHWAVDFMRAGDDDAREFRFVVVGNTKDASGWRYDFRMNFDATISELELLLDYVGTGAPATDTLLTATVDVFLGAPTHVRLDMDQDGTGVDWNLTLDGVSAGSGTIASTTLQGVGFVAPVSLPGTGSSTAFSHIAVFEGDPPALADTIEAAFGYDGEAAGDRFSRLSGESDVTDTVDGTAADTVPMGPQFPGTLAAQYAEIQATDDGLISDTVTAAGVTYKTGRARYNQAAALTLDYAAYEVAPPLHPVIDDKRIRNDVTVQRRGGATARAVDDASVTALGRYTDKPDVNTFSDLVLEASAGWQLHTGTIGGTRFERVTVDLDATPDLKTAVVATGIGDRIDLVNLPAELTPDTAGLIAIGWNETVAPDRRKITFNCIPEAALHIAEVEHQDYAIVGALFTTTNEALDTTETGVTVFLGGDGPWVHEVDFDITIGGERMTVTAAGAAAGTFPSQTQTLTVVRSVNGVVKAHPNGSDVVQLFNRAYIGL
jgi:hypothetical protein